MFKFRRLHRGETDGELLLLLISITGGIAAWGWFRLSLPTPGCNLKQLTGISCPTCGTTRSLRAFLEGDWGTALQFNPLIFVLLLLLALTNVYSLVVVVGRLPRMRFTRASDKTFRRLRLAVVLIVAANWLYVAFRG